MREFVKHIATSLREDATWKVDKHWAENAKLGVKVWVANNFWFVHLRFATDRSSYGWTDGRDIYLSLAEKACIWFAYRKLRKLDARRAEADVLEAIIQRRLSAGGTK